jgi:hypothetical protein
VTIFLSAIENPLSWILDLQILDCWIQVKLQEAGFASRKDARLVSLASINTPDEIPVCPGQFLPRNYAILNTGGIIAQRSTSVKG